MCVIAVCNEKKLNHNDFSSMFNTNPDGVGFGWYRGNRTVISKGFMELDKAWDYYDKYVNILPHICHFRIGTSGTNTPLNCHPFPININYKANSLKYEGTKSWLFHNGVVLNYLQYQLILELNGIKTSNDPVDSQIIAMVCDKIGTIKFLKTLSGLFAVLNKDNITTIGTFNKHDGFITSNNSWNSCCKHWDYKNSKFVTYPKKNKNNNKDSDPFYVEDYLQRMGDYY